ncbi:MAG: LysR family transcriptional regulator [Lachnospiraceae bacterium]|nr:LysR family transcriptional regulator [Lachnospiraceae bacterium]
MDIRDYEYVVAIAEHGSISRAAQQLFITQSALTRFLQRTEKQTGVALFHRRGNQFLLTEAGRQYVDTGRVIMHLDRQLAEKLEEEKRIHKSLIRISYSMGRSDDLIGNIFPRFLERFPDVKIKARGDTSRKSMMALQNGDLDLVLVTNVEKIPGYRYIPVERSCMALAVREDSPLLAMGNRMEGYPFPVIKPELLAGERLISMPGSTNSGNMTREIIEKYGLDVEIRMEFSDVRSLLDAVDGGLGIAMMMTVPVMGRRVRYLSLEGLELPEQTVELVYQSDKVLSRAMEYLVELLTKRVEERSV